MVTGETTSKINRDRTVLSHIAKEVHRFFSEKHLDYCWNANEILKDSDGFLNENRMPASPSGLNEFERFDNVAALVCINPPTWVKNILLSFLGINASDKAASDEVYRQWRMAHTYQAVGRCSLRNRECKSHDVVVVLSKHCAEDLAALFKGSTVMGCITNLPPHSVMERAKKREGKILYEPSDNKAWHVWKQRHPDDRITKDNWYMNERRFRKTRMQPHVQ